MGLHMLDYADDRQRTIDSRDTLRRAMLSSGHYDFDDLFPEVAPKKVASADDDLNDPDAAYDFSAVQWESPSTMGGIDDFDRLQEELLRETSVSISEGDFSDDDLEAGEWI